MNELRVLLGVPLAVLVVLPLALATRSIRRRLVPSWHGSDAALADIVLALTIVTVVSEVLGTVGLFRVGPFVLACLVVGGGTWAALRSASPDRAAAPVPSPDETARPRWVPWVAGGGVLLVAGSWVSRTFGALEHGITTIDSSWYHLPVASRFVQTGSTTSVRLMDSDSVTAYFPATSSIYHAVFYLLFRSDIFSTVLNLGWLAFGLLAAWNIGNRFSVGPASVLAAAIGFASPYLVETQPGGALTDVVGMALLLAGFAIALRPGARPMAQDFLVALAAGLATGMKLTFLFPAAALCLGIVITSPAAGRVRRVALVAAGTVLSGGYWYARNALLVHNPVPSFGGGIGPLRLPAIKGLIEPTNVASLLFDGSAWSNFFLPGLRDALGPVWFLVLAAAAVGTVGSIAYRGDSRVRMTGIVAAASFVAFLFTPQYLFGGVFFATNLRYGAPAIMLGLVFLPVTLRRMPRIVVVGLASLVVLTQLDPVSWPVGFGGPSFFASVPRAWAGPGAVATVLVSGVVVVAVLMWRRVPPHRWKVSVGIVIATILVTAPLAIDNHRYQSVRYVGVQPFPTVYSWVRNVHHARIGVFGAYIHVKYPFAGADWSNRVDYLGVERADGGWDTPKNCDQWLEIVEAGKYDYLIVLGPANGDGPLSWTSSQPDARIVVHTPLGSQATGKGRIDVVALDPTVRNRGCGLPLPVG